MALTIEAASYPAVEIAEVIELEPSAKYCLPYGVHSLQVLNGVALITTQAEEHILKCGDELTTPRQPHAVIISAAHYQRLRFEIHRQ